MLALGGDHPDALRAGDPDVPSLVDLHPVRDALLDHAGADAVEEHPAVRERAVVVHVVDLDERPRRVVDVEERLVRGEAQPVRHLVLVLPDDELQLVLAAAGRDHEDALPAELPLALDPEAGEAPVPRVGEVDRPVRADGDVVRAVQVLALVVERERLAHAVGALAHERARDVLADEQVEVRVEGHPVALERRVPDLGHRAVQRDLPPDVGRHVGEVEDLLRRVPDRPLGEGESGCELLDGGALLDELVDRVRLRFDTRHGVSPFVTASSPRDNILVRKVCIRRSGCRPLGSPPPAGHIPEGARCRGRNCVGRHRIESSVRSRRARPRHRRLHPGLERGAEPPRRPRRARWPGCPMPTSS